MEDFTRRQALIDLMALKDEFDQFRIHRLTCAGKPERYAEVSRLTSIFVQRRLLELEHGREWAA